MIVGDDYRERSTPSSSSLRSSMQVDEVKLTPLKPNKDLLFYGKERPPPLISLLNNEQFSDVRLKFNDGKVIFAHKAVLSRSSTFNAMFTGKMKESKLQEVDIGYPSASFLLFLEFLYTNEFEFKEDSELEELLMIAEEYNVDGVKTYCADKILDSIEVSNVCSLLGYAVKYSAPMLKRTCLKYMKEHIKEVVKTEGYKQLEQSSLYAMMLIDNYCYFKGEVKIFDFSKKNQHIYPLRLEDIQWQIYVYTKGDKTAKDKFVSVYIQCQSPAYRWPPKWDAVDCYWAISIQDPIPHNLEGRNTLRANDQKGYTKFLSLELLNQHVVNDTFTFYVQLGIYRIYVEHPQIYSNDGWQSWD